MKDPKNSDEVVRIPWETDRNPENDIYIENGILKMNREYKYLRSLTQASDSTKANFFRKDSLSKGYFAFNVSLRFMDMMFIQGAEKLVDKVTRAILDLRKGDISNLQILQVDKTSPKAKFFNLEYCAVHAILKVDLDQEFDNGDRKEVFLPMELYLSPYYNGNLIKVSTEDSNINSLKKQNVKVRLD